MVAIRLKTREQIEQMRLACRLVRQVLDRIAGLIAPGVKTEQLDREAEKMCLDAGAECLFKGVPGRGGVGPFPAAICASVNEELVHGIPGNRVIREGDIISIDFGVRINGWCGDSAETFIVGEVPQDVRRLVDTTRKVLEMAIDAMQPGKRWSKIAMAMQQYVEQQGFAVVREFVGHGIGQEMWEDPKVPNFLSRELESRDIVLEPGLVLAVEPMVNMGMAAVEYAPDGWTVRTRDRLPSAHFEHVVAVTTTGVEVLTR